MPLPFYEALTEAATQRKGQVAKADAYATKVRRDGLVATILDELQLTAHDRRMLRAFERRNPQLAKLLGEFVASCYEQDIDRTVTASFTYDSRDPKKARRPQMEVEVSARVDRGSITFRIPL